MPYQKVLEALVDPTRRAILESIRQEECTVGAIAACQPVSRPAVSQHLRVLHDAGLVSVRAQGTRRFYLLRRDGLESLRRYVDGYWTDVLGAYAAEVERQVGSK